MFEIKAPAKFQLEGSKDQDVIFFSLKLIETPVWNPRVRARSLRCLAKRDNSLPDFFSLTVWNVYFTKALLFDKRQERDQTIFFS